MGWNPGNGSTKEIFSMQELIAEFSLKNLSKSPVIVNFHRLEWFNKMHYSLQLDRKDRIQPYKEAMKKHLQHERFLIKIDDNSYYQEIIKIGKGRITTIEKFISICTPFFVDPSYNETTTENGKFLNIVNEFYAEFENCNEWTSENIKNIINAVNPGIPFKNRANILRKICMNIPIGPPLSDIIRVLGKQTVLRRMKNFVNSQSFNYLPDKLAEKVISVGKSPSK